MAFTRIDGTEQVIAGSIFDASIAPAANIQTSKLADGPNLFFADGTRPATGNFSLGNFQIKNLGAPTAATDATTKSYVDSVAQGLSIKTACLAATTGALPTNVYNNGAGGVGATLTATAFGALVIDGVTIPINTRVVVKDEALLAHNGIFFVTNPGGVAAFYILTRATDFDEPTEIPGSFTFIQEGTINADTGWVCTTDPPVIVGTTSIVFTQFSGAGSVTGGTLITVIGNQVNLANGSAPAQIIVTNASNIPAYVTPSLDVSLIASGAFTVNGLKGSALGAPTADGFIKRNSGNTAWEYVGYGSTVDTVCQGNDPRLAGGGSAVPPQLAYAGWL